MYKTLFTLILVFCLGNVLKAQEKDTCRVGVFITSLYDLSLPENSFNADFWIWFNYRNDSITPLQNFEITNAKEVEYSLATTEKKGNINWATQKCRTTVKKQWNIEDFPFDKQKLTIIVEEAENDLDAMVYLPDKKNSKLNKDINIEGWLIKDFEVHTGISTYETTYGDPELSGHSAYTNFEIIVSLERVGLGLFFKLFIGVYIAFAISVLVFFIDPVDVDPRFGLSVGSLFAAVGNKYIVDSILPETITFTLVDKVHLLTFFFIFLALMVSVQSLYLFKQGKVKASKRLDIIAFYVTVSSFLLINLWMIAGVLT